MVHASRLGELFVQVLAMCAKAGMVRVGTVAVDGTKIAANAGLSANRTYEKIRQDVERILQEADEVDAAEDEQFGDARGDELPAELADPVTRRARLERAKREIEAEQAALVAEHEAMLARRAGTPPAYRPQPARAPAQGDGPGAQPPADAKRNITDPDSRIMHARGALIQAFNAQALVGEGRVIIAADVTTSPNDSNQLEPMLAQARENLRSDRPPGEDQVPARRRRLLEPRSHRDRAQRHRRGDPDQRSAQHDTHVRAPPGRRGRPHQQDPQDPCRQAPVPTTRGNWSNRSSRTPNTPARSPLSAAADTEAVRAEWRLIAATHNLLKLFRHQPQTA